MPEKFKKAAAAGEKREVTIDEAVEKLRHLPYEDLGFARVDHHRHIRQGFPEVIYCPGKTTEQIIKIFTALAAKGNNVLATRAGEDVFEAIAQTGNFPSPDMKKQPEQSFSNKKSLRHRNRSCL